MFVTKIPDSTGPNEIQKDNVIQKSYIYLFNDLNKLSKACKALSVSTKQKSILYVSDYDSKYYLFLEKEWPGAGEFFGYRCKESARQYIAEHGRLLCLNSLELLSQLA